MLHFSLAFIRTLSGVASATLLGLAAGAVSAGPLTVSAPEGATLPANAQSGPQALTILAQADLSNGLREAEQRDWRRLKTQFLQADDFEPVSEAEFDSWFDDGWYTDERFGGQTESIFLPDAQMSPIERAVLLFEHLEGALPHARYRLTLGTQFPTVESDMQSPLAFVEVTRFNLGPALYADLQEQYDEVADIDEFGVGPHVARRFVFTPIQGLNAHLLGGARKVLDAEQAEGELCFGQSCLSLEANIGTVGDWQVVSADNDPGLKMLERNAAELGAEGDSAVNGGAGTATATGLNPSVAQVSAELAELHIGSEYGEPVESIQAPAPYLSFIIEQNIAGQVPAITAVSHQDHLMDDALAAIWYQRMQADGMAPHWERLLEHRRARGG